MVGCCAPLIQLAVRGSCSTRALCHGNPLKEREVLVNPVNFDTSMLLPLMPVLVLVAVLIGWSLVDIIRRPVEHLPKWAWVLIVLLAVPVGAVIYIIIGRAQGERLRDEDLR